MSGPWEDFRAVEKPPWEDYAAPKAAERVQEDQYRRAAREDLDRSGGTGAGRLQRQVMQGLTFGLADEVIAGAMTPIEMIRRRTLSPTEAYNYAKAREDLALERDRQRDGMLGGAAEIAAGIGSGASLAQGGVTAARFLGPNAGLLGRSGAMLADGAALGALTGAATGSGDTRVSQALTGGAFGGVVGGLLPGVSQVVSTVAAPITSNIAARINPERYAKGQLARTVTESGRTAQQIADDVAQAAREGQGVFTVADALGDAGQRTLGTVANNPGRGSAAVREFMDARQAEQGRRLSGFVDDAFGTAASTAARETAAQEAARKAEAGLLYGGARQQAVPVDVSAAVRAADEILTPGATRLMSPQTQIADNTIESVVRRARGMLTDGRSLVSDFNAALRVKFDLDDMIQAAAPRQQGFLKNIRNELDRALEAASPGYAQARNSYRDASRAIEAIDEGRQAAMRGRFEDTTARYAALSPREQAGYRSGYADRLIADMQGQAAGANKARPFTADGYTAERQAMAANPDLLNRRISREDLMFQTRARATGGSQTNDRGNADAAMSVSPEFLTNLLNLNMGGAARALVTRGRAVAGGNTEPVRNALADMLLRRGPDGARDIAAILAEATKTAQGRQELIRLLTGGAMGGTAATPGALNSPSTSGR